MGRNAQVWIESILRTWQPIVMEITLEADVSGEELQALFRPERLQAVLEDFAKNELLGPSGELEGRFRERMTPEYYPKVLEKGRLDALDGDDEEFDESGFARRLSRSAAIDAGLSVRGGGSNRPRNPDLGGMQAGFKDVLTVLQRTEFTEVEGGAVLGIGPFAALEALRLSDYMYRRGGGSTSSRYNKLFYAIEYGTGVKENVGSAAFVNREGPTKVDNPPGAWEFGTYLWAGQKGFHIFYEERTRKPVEYYAERIRQRFGGYLLRHLKGK